MNKYTNLIIVVLVWCLSACALNTAGKPDLRDKTDTLRQQDVSWDPAALDSFFTDFTGVKNDGSSAAEVLERLKGNGMEAGERLIAGFRVQLVATRDEAVARRALQDAQVRFSENTYLLYDNPYYKLRIGDCHTRAEADSLQQHALERGFAGAWIVRSLVEQFPSQRSGVMVTPVDSLQNDPQDTW